MRLTLHGTKVRKLNDRKSDRNLKIEIFLCIKCTDNQIKKNEKNANIFCHRSLTFVTMNIDYSMISAHERFLFTSCDTSKKRTGEFFDASQRGNKIAKALSTISCINFRRTRIFFPFQLKDWKRTNVKMLRSSNQRQQR